MSAPPGAIAEGRSSTDPTSNVLDLVRAAERRQDDLREAESAHFRQLLDMITVHFAELRKAEAARLDAIRIVDVNAVQRAAEVASETARALATVVATTSETMRVQVSSTASSLASALDAALAPIKADIADLRRVQYEQSGAKASTREGVGDRRSQVGMIVAIVGLAASILFAALAFAT